MIVTFEMQKETCHFYFLQGVRISALRCRSFGGCLVAHTFEPRGDLFDALLILVELD